MMRQPILDSGFGNRYSNRSVPQPANRPDIWYKQIGLQINDLVPLTLYLNPPANPTPEEQRKIDLIREVLLDWGVTI